ASDGTIFLLTGAIESTYYSFSGKLIVTTVAKLASDSISAAEAQDLPNSMLYGSTFDLKYDEDNQVLWATCGNRLYAYNKAGTVLKNFAPTDYRIGSDPYLALITSITLVDGTLYYSVTDNDYSVGAVGKITYDTSSGFNYLVDKDVLGGLASDTQLFALNVGGNEQLLVREYDYSSGEDTVVIYDTDDFSAPIYEEHGVTSNLHAVAVSGNGNSLYLAQYDNGQVSALNKDGNTYAADTARQYPPDGKLPAYPGGGGGGCDTGAGGIALIFLASAAILKRREG
ncbi:MAG: hypothetical protein LBS53_13440, partial [Synergistaceae bacterium]|nr:hypothetical protein [Synergistaceae bacterium]